MSLYVLQFLFNKANTNETTVTTHFMSKAMLLSPHNDENLRAMETDQSTYDLQKDIQQRTTGKNIIDKKK